MRAGAAQISRCVCFAGLFIAAVLVMAACGTSSAPQAGDETVPPATPAPVRTEEEAAAQPAPSPNLRFERISVEEGLSENTVHCVFQDSSGFLWLCTEDGLNRYDGHNLKVYRPNPEQNSIAFHYVQSVCESPEGVLWIATVGGGLDRLDLDTGQFTHHRYRSGEPSLSNNWLNALFCDRDGSIWMGTVSAGLDHLDPATGVYVHYTHDEGSPASLSHNTVNAIYRDGQGVLWIGTENGLNRGDPVRQRFIKYRHDPGDPHSLSGDRVRAIYEDREGALWIGTDGGLDRFDDQTERFEHYRHDPNDEDGAGGSLSHNSVQTIFEDREGILWVGTDGGLNALDRAGERFVRYQNDLLDPGSLSANQVLSIYQDREGVLWVGTDSGGLNKYDPFSDRFAHYQARPGDPGGLINDKIWSIYEDGEGILWIGTNGGGLARFDREAETATHYQHDADDPHSLSHDVVRAVLQDRAGALWIGTDGGGLNRLDPPAEPGQAARFVRYQYDAGDPHSLSHDEVRALYEDREGVLWIATDGGGLNRFDREADRFVRYLPDPSQPGHLRGGSLWSLAEDRAGTLWIGTAGAGLHKFDRDTEQFRAYLHDPSDIILDIHEDRSGQLWLATYGNGLYKFDRETETFAVYREEHGLASNSVYGILEEDGPVEGKGGMLWLSTNNGLSRFDPRIGSFKNYDTSDGLQSQEFSTGAYHQSASGEMFFGGINGLNAFYPDQIREDNPYVPPVVLTSLTQGGESLDAEAVADGVEAFTLNWPNNYFEFEFAALSLARPAKNQHAYKLEGFDEDWIQAGTKRFGRYTNLPGGTYTLWLRGSNGEGVWNSEGTAVRVTVVPPFWQTWTFRLLVLVVLVAGVVGVYRQRVRNIEARSRELEREVEERTREIERRRRVAEGLRDILAVLNSDRPLDEVLEYIVVQAGQMLGAETAILYQVEGEGQHVAIQAGAGLAKELGGQRVAIQAGAGLANELGGQRVAIQAGAGLPDELAGSGPIPLAASCAGEAILARQPHAIADLHALPAPETAAGSDDPQGARWLAVTRRRYRSFLAAPLIADGAVDHCLAFYYAEPQAFSDEDLSLAVALADQAALAIENARLYENAKELAAMEERQRLARDLHDAVSQTLFSASLIAEVLPELWENSPEEGEQLLEKLQQLSRGALAEMRALLMELRPAALVEASMEELLRQLGQAVSGREGIPVVVRVDEPNELPTEVHVALYRIAQEALNNVVKHAQAGRVDVSFKCAPAESHPPAGEKPAGQGEGVELRICDDGLGFDVGSVPQERLGLGIMRERAEAIGAVLAIESRVGEGTEVMVVWAEDGRQRTEDK